MTRSTSRDEATPTPQADTVKRFGRYTLIRRIAHGGMATLYLARLEGPEGFEKFYAIKKIHPHLAEEREFVAMFLDEARFASQIQHPNVVQIFELGEVAGEFFFAMEYLAGENLATVMKELALRSLPPPRPFIAHVIARVAAGLHAAHELRDPAGAPLGLVHRDVSPQNVLITYDGLVKLLDFGIAKAAGRLSRTATGELKGKYAYMAPEQIIRNDVDRRTDIFSLGIVLYEATTMERLFKDETEVLTLERVARCDVPPPREFDPGYPPELEAIVLRTLRRDPGERYQTAAALADDLDAYVDSAARVDAAALASWMSEIFPERAEEKRRLLERARGLVAPAPGRRRRWIVGGIVVAVLALAGLAIVLLRAGPPPHRVGTLRVSSSPVPGVVALDHGPPAGTTPLELDDLAVGDHSVSVSADGYERWEATFAIQQPGQLVTVLVPLTPAAPIAAPPPPAPPPLPAVDAGADAGADAEATHAKAGPATRGFGYLNLSSTPWSEVYLGERALGTTPLVMAKLPAGRRRLKLLREGQPPARFLAIDVKAGETVRRTYAF
jgi:eukaryotic-like serine/threonine-protein kinase